MGSLACHMPMGFSLATRRLDRPQPNPLPGIQDRQLRIGGPYSIHPYRLERYADAVVEPGAGQIDHLPGAGFEGGGALARSHHHRYAHVIPTHPLYELFLRLDTDENRQGSGACCQHRQQGKPCGKQTKQPVMHNS